MGYTVAVRDQQTPRRLTVHDHDRPGRTNDKPAEDHSAHHRGGYGHTGHAPTATVTGQDGQPGHPSDAADRPPVPHTGRGALPAMSASGHTRHGDHGDHVGQFRRLFWIMLLLALPVVAFSPMFAMILGYTLPDTAWAGWISPR